MYGQFCKIHINCINLSPQVVVMLSLFRSLARARHRAHAIEFTLIAAIVAIAGVSAMNALGKTPHILSAVTTAL